MLGFEMDRCWGTVAGVSEYFCRVLMLDPRPWQPIDTLQPDRMPRRFEDFSFPRELYLLISLGSLSRSFYPLLPFLPQGSSVSPSIKSSTFFEPYSSSSSSIWSLDQHADDIQVETPRRGSIHLFSANHPATIAIKGHTSMRLSLLRPGHGDFPGGSV